MAPPPVVNQLLQVKGFTFRLCRKTKAGTTDVVVFDATELINIRVAGTIDSNTIGGCHIDFKVAEADCIITTLNDTALNPVNGVGFVQFSYKTPDATFRTVFIDVRQFIQESASEYYIFYLNGTCSGVSLPPLYNEA